VQQIPENGTINIFQIKKMVLKL